MGEIGTDHDGVGTMLAAVHDHAARRAVLVDHSLDGFAEADVNAKFAGQSRHRLRYGAAAADGMVDAVLVLQEAED